MRRRPWPCRATGWVDPKTGQARLVQVLGLLAGLIQLGFIASFISEPVLKGFIVGLALTIIIGQVSKLLGVPKTGGNFFEQTWGVISQLGDVDGLTLMIGGLSLALVLIIRAVVAGGAGVARRGVARHRRNRGVPARRCGRGHRGTDPVRAARGGDPRPSRPGSLPRSRRASGGGAADRVRRRPGRGEDVRGQSGLRGVGEPRAQRSGRGQPRAPGCAREWSSTAACPRPR